MRLPAGKASRREALRRVAGCAAAAATAAASAAASVAASTATAVRAAFAVVAAGSANSRQAFAAGPRWPPLTLRIVVAYPVGGVSSDIARELARGLEARVGVPVIVEHRPGAGGTLAMDLAAKGPADGSLLVFSAITPLTLAPWLGPLPYDPEHEVAPVAALMATPVLVLGTPALQAAAAADFGAMLELARSRPGAVRWATSGIGTTGHLVQQRVAAAAGVSITHVPYTGGGRQLTDALGGHFEVLSSNVAAAQLRLVREGKLVAPAVSGERRVPSLPQVPTLAELGFAAANQVSTFGLFAPGRTPAALVERLNAEAVAVLQAPALRERLEASDNVPLGGSAGEFARRIAAEREVHRAWVARSRAQPPR
ncbi:MAG: tripartite tricarboxylate transporter substrate binding protein [Rubrivivax sp.]|nr:tripartite tricarboxylate transporter substrate binding protein [Rubrivivax sp.]